MAIPITRRSLIGGAAGVLAACHRGLRRRPGELVLGFSEDRGTTDPTRLVAMDWTPLGLIFETLVFRAGGGSLQAALAERWERLDERTVRFIIRRGVRFSDGEALTSQVCADSLQRSAGERWTTQALPRMEAQAAGPNEILVRTTEPFGPLLDYLAYINFAIARRSGSSWLGTGPLRWTEYRPLEHARLERNDHYWNQQPALHSVLFRYLPDTQSRWLAIRAGEIDAMRSVPLAETQLARLPRGVRLFRNHGRHVHYLGINRSFGPLAAELDDARIRKALRLSIGHQAIVRAVLHGAGRPAGSPLSPWFPSAIAAEPEPRDLAAAEALFAERGWRRGRDGVLARGGSRFRLRYVYSATWMACTQPLAELVQSQMRESGVEVDLVPMEWSAASAAERRGEAELRHRGLPLAVGGSHHMLWNGFHSSTSAGASIHLRDKQVNALLAEWSVTSDAARQRATSQEVERRVVATEGFLPLFHEEEIVAAGERIGEAGGLAHPHPYIYPLDLAGMSLSV